MADKDSILNSIKKILGIDLEYDVYDQDIIMHINSVFSTLNQLGVGPDAGFYIEDDEQEWSAFIEDDKKINSVKTYIAMKVRLIFDPPATSFVITAFENQIKEFEWRLNVQAESQKGVVVP